MFAVEHSLSMFHYIHSCTLANKYPSNHRSEDDGMDMVEEHPSNHRPQDEGMDMENIGIVDDITMEVDVVEREHETRGVDEALDQR
jgi:hypothetical protein